MGGASKGRSVCLETIGKTVILQRFATRFEKFAGVGGEVKFEML